MNDYQTFPTRKAAQAEIDGLIGWDAKPVKLTAYDDSNNPADVWVIECRQPWATRHSDPLYLRNDGYVR